MDSSSAAGNFFVRNGGVGIAIVFTALQLLGLKNCLQMDAFALLGGLAVIGLRIIYLVRFYDI